MQENQVAGEVYVKLLTRGRYEGSNMFGQDDPLFNTTTPSSPQLPVDRSF